MTQIASAEWLVRALANERVEFVFGFATSESAALLAAPEGTDIEFITMRHEGVPVVAITPPLPLVKSSSLSSSAV